MSLMLKRTALGIQLRASTEDFRMAQLVGVRANWVISSAFAITGFLAAVVGILYVLRTGAIDPEIGRGPLLVAFVGGVIGGLGSFAGAAIGGFVLGGIINGLQASLPTQFASHTLMFAFIAVIAILVLAPNGLVAIRGGAVKRAWRRFRPEPVAEGQSPDGPAHARSAGAEGMAAARPLPADRRQLGGCLGRRQRRLHADDGADVPPPDRDLGLQMFSGNSGVLSFGHVAFVAIGAYTSALLTIPPEIKEFTYLEMPGFLKSWVFPAELGAIEATLAGAGFAAAFALSRRLRSRGSPAWLRASGRSPFS